MLHGKAILIALPALLSARAAGGVELYVSPAGDDGNPGTPARPMRTLEAARDAVRKRKAGGGATVWLTAGRHVRRKTFELGPPDSGTKDAPVVYKAVQPRRVYVDGGLVVPPSACAPVADPAVLKRLVPEARGRILRIDLKALGIAEYGKLGPRGFARPYRAAPLELFIDGRAQQVARWPNPGRPHVPMGKVIDKGSVPRTGDYSFRGGVFEYGTKRAERWAAASDLYISGIFNYGYADDTIPVAKLDTKAGTIQTAWPHLYGFVRRGFTKWYALNLIEEIDLPGEYCVDRDSGILYFLPAGKIDGALIQVSIMAEPMVAMEGASHVRFEGITFENARGSAFYIERGEGNLVAGCVLRNLGLVGVQIGQGTTPLPDGRHDAHGGGAGADGLVHGRPASRVLGSWQNHIYAHTAWDRKCGTGHGVLSCDIYNAGAGGVVLGGGDRRTLAPGGSFVRNCDIHHVNRWDRMYRTPVNIDGVGNRIEHCLLHSAPGQAILLHGNDHVIELNHIHHVVTDMSDQAAIYMGRDPSESGNVIRHNFFHDIYNYHEGGHGVQAIFFDDCCTFGATVIGNVLYRTGNTGVIKFNGGGLSPIVNNIFIDCPRPVQGGSDNTKRVVTFMKGALGTQRLRKAVDITKPPHSTKYPVVAEVYAGKRRVTTPFERNYVVKGDTSQFVDAERMNFQLKSGSKVYGQIEGFQRIPFEKIGLYVDEHRRALPVSAPRIRPAGGAFFKQVEVTVSPGGRDAGRKDVEIRCTLDGSDPTRRSDLCRGPLVLRRSATLRARAFSTRDPGLAPSPAAVASYRKIDLVKGQPLWLSDLPHASASCHNGVKLDTNYAGKGSVRLGGKSYRKSVMICPAAGPGGGRSHIHYSLAALPIRYKRLRAVVGIDGAMATGRGSAVFLVEAVRDGKVKQLLKTPILRGGGKPLTVDVDITGADALHLRTTDAGDNIHADHAVWADARLE